MKDLRVMFKNCKSFTNCIRKLNNAQVGNTKDIDVVMPMYDLKKYSDKEYPKASGSLFQYDRDEATDDI